MSQDFEDQFRKHIEKRVQAIKEGALEYAETLISERFSSVRYKQMFASGMKITNQHQDGSFRLSLDPEVRFLEDGYGPYDMLSHLLSRSSAKTNKDGERYVNVPITKEIKTTAKGGEALNKMFANRNSERIMGALTSSDNQVTDRLKNIGGVSDIKGIRSGFLKDTVSIDRVREYNVDVSDKKSLRGLKPVNTSFMGTKFRTAKASDAGTGKWQHPGYGGAHILMEVNDWIRDQFAKMNR